MKGGWPLPDIKMSGPVFLGPSLRDMMVAAYLLRGMFIFNFFLNGIFNGFIELLSEAFK